jgi:hypothetical protein
MMPLDPFEAMLANGETITTSHLLLAEKLEYLIEHSELWAEVDRKGQKCVEEHYDLDKQNNQLWRFITDYSTEHC